MISVEGVTKSYGPIVAVDRVSFEVDRGEVLGFLGPNGAGKTTTMRMLTGTLQPDQGAISFDGVPIAAELTSAKSRVGYLPEANPLYDDMLVCEFLEYVARLRGLDADQSPRAIGRAVEETGLGDVFFRPIGRNLQGLPAAHRDGGARSCTSPRFWSWTSRPRGWTPTSASRFAGWSTRWGPSARSF